MLDIRCTYTLTFKVYTLCFLLQTLVKMALQITINFYPKENYNYSNQNMFTASINYVINHN